MRLGGSRGDSLGGMLFAAPTSSPGPQTPFQRALASIQRALVVSALVSVAATVGYYAAFAPTGGVASAPPPHAPHSPSSFGTASALLPSPAAAVHLPPPHAAPSPGGVPLPAYPIDPSWTLDAAVLRGGVTFLAIGDWGRGGKEGQEIVAPVLADWAGASHAGFIVSVGDNVYPDGISPESTPAQAAELLDTFFTRVYSQPQLQALPWHLITGNHDWRGSLAPQLEFTQDKRWNIGLNYTKTWQLPGGDGCVSAVFADTTPLVSYYSSPGVVATSPLLAANIAATDVPSKIAWTKAALATAGATCNAAIIIAHHPLLSPGEHGDSEELKSIYLQDLDTAGIDAYISGHDHILAHSRKGEDGRGAEHIITGGGSSLDFLTRETAKTSPDTRYIAIKQGFTVHSFNATHAAHTYVWAGTDAPSTPLHGKSGGSIKGSIVFQVVRPLREKPLRVEEAKEGGGEEGEEAAEEAAVEQAAEEEAEEEAAEEVAEEEVAVEAPAAEDEAADEKEVAGEPQEEVAEEEPVAAEAEEAAAASEEPAEAEEAK